MNRFFFLRKGRVIEKISSNLYRIKDCFNGNEILATISGTQHQAGFSFDLNEITYVVVPRLDLKRGRIYTEYHLKIEHAQELLEDKKLLDDNIDPMAQL